MGSEKSYVVDTETLSETKNNSRKPELPGLLGNAFLEIENQVISLHAEWGIYHQLFEKEEDWSLLVQSSYFAWPILHDSLVERCILHVTRLTDPAASLNSNEKTNLSFAYLIRLLTVGHDDELCSELQRDLDSLKAQIEPLKHLRDKVLAHADESVAFGRKAYPMVSISKIHSLLPRVSDFCQKVRMHFGLVHFHYDWCVGAWAGGIIASFRKLERFEELRDRIHRGESLDVYQLRQAIMKAGRAH